MGGLCSGGTGAGGTNIGQKIRVGNSEEHFCSQPQHLLFNDAVSGHVNMSTFSFTLYPLFHLPWAVPAILLLFHFIVHPRARFLYKHCGKLREASFTRQGAAGSTRSSAPAAQEEQESAEPSRLQTAWLCRRWKETPKENAGTKQGTSLQVQQAAI